MTIEERKQKTYEGLQLLEKDITRLQNNISELKQILEDIHDRICDEYCKWPSQYPLATDDEAYNRMGEEHCDKCPVRRLT